MISLRPELLGRQRLAEDARGLDRAADHRQLATQPEPPALPLMFRHGCI
jgi:hypothetical protein